MSEGNFTAVRNLIQEGQANRDTKTKQQMRLRAQEHAITAQTYQLEFNNEQAIHSYKKALEFDPKNLSYLNNIGLVYQHIGKYQDAIHYYNQGLHALKDNPDKKYESYFTGNLGVVHDSQGEYSRAIEFHNKHLNIARQIGGL